MIEATFRPIDQWPGELQTDDFRSYSRFKGSYPDTLDLLERELEHLRARDIVIQLALSTRDIRNDGWPRAGSTPEHPGVIVAFGSVHGPLKYFTDEFKGIGSSRPGWQANLRAIALGLEALRKVERYGITKRGEQYTGWSALPPGTIAAGAAPMTHGEAVMFLRDASDWQGILASSAFTEAYRRAAKKLHPDAGGDTEKFKRLQEAVRVLGGEA